MTLIWKSLLHANFRCGRMYSARAEKQTLSHSCTVPSMPRMCERMSVDLLIVDDLGKALYAANVRANVTPETDKRL